mmetsp:Transcript_55922/g.122319  ORF Transcript_55922/g.122319 Transcript_55922/m.122319 type:complete len:273 (+) Transcript_55922:186-1004(+)
MSEMKVLKVSSLKSLSSICATQWDPGPSRAVTCTPASSSFFASSRPSSRRQSQVAVTTKTRLPFKPEKSDISRLASLCKSSRICPLESLNSQSQEIRRKLLGHAGNVPKSWCDSLDMWGSTMGYIKAVGSHLSSRRRPWQATKDPAEQLATLMLLVLYPIDEANLSSINERYALTKSSTAAGNLNSGAKRYWSDAQQNLPYLPSVNFMKRRPHTSRKLPNIMPPPCTHSSNGRSFRSQSVGRWKSTFTGSPPPHKRSKVCSVTSQLPSSTFS